MGSNNNLKKYNTSSVGGKASSKPKYVAKTMKDTPEPTLMQTMKRKATKLRKAVVGATIGAAPTKKPKAKTSYKDIKSVKPTFKKQTTGKIKEKHKKMKDIY